MIRRLMGVVVLILAATSFQGCELIEGPSCCALKKFCTTCTTCTGDNTAVANKGDEAACKVVVQRFRNENQFCNPEDKPPKHTIDEFVMQCGD
jgi:hypothetical protein